jgi:hypothetical protein
MFIYLNNDPGGAAVADARALQRRFARAGRDVRTGATAAGRRTTAPAPQ